MWTFIVKRFTWDISKISEDSEVCVRGNQLGLKDILANDGSEGVLGMLSVGFKQPRMVWSWKKIKDSTGLVIIGLEITSFNLEAQ